MPHGTLKEYVAKNGQDISPAQRRQWAAEAIELLHSRGVLQADVGLHNFLLDAELSLRICDFGGSSLNGSRAMVIPGVRYRLPSPSGQPWQPTSVKEDLFALGSTIYFIATGHEPYTELGEDEDEVQKRYRDGVFPDLAGVPFGETIALCWRQEAESARTALELLQCPSSGTM
jgi:serine/threonine protein kinase